MNGLWWKRALPLAACLLLATSAAGQQSELVVEGIQLRTHLGLDLTEQDVHIEKQRGSGEIFRPAPDDLEAYRNAPLYAGITPRPHAPWSYDVLGPYPKGEPLGFTLDEWLSATGTASYSCKNGQGTLKTKFTNLVPKGVYTMWHVLALKQHFGCSECAFAGLVMPLGDPSGAQSVFTSDNSGRAEYEATFAPCLRLGDADLIVLLAIAYHSDGKTYGPRPGPEGISQGWVTHIHLMGMLPEKGAYGMENPWNPCDM